MLEDQVVQRSRGGWSQTDGLDLGRLRRAWQRSQIYLMLGSGWVVERLALAADAIYLIERKTTLKLLVSSYRLKHRALRVLIGARR